MFIFDENISEYFSASKLRIQLVIIF